MEGKTTAELAIVLVGADAQFKPVDMCEICRHKRDELRRELCSEMEFDCESCPEERRCVCGKCRFGGRCFSLDEGEVMRIAEERGLHRLPVRDTGREETQLGGQ